MRPILIIDDSLTVRMDLAEAFGDGGFETVLCATAEDARRALESCEPSMIVLDVVLPDADGIELLAELRDRPGGADLPIVLLSGEAEVRDRIRGLTHGASEYVGKPYDAASLVARARAYLRASSGDERQQPTILVIDDSLTYREELSETLRAAGFATETAASGEDGLRIAAVIHPDAIIVDEVMAGMDGTAVVRRIRLDPGLRSTPCLLLTATEGAAGEVAALDSGADDCVRKGDGTEIILVRLRGVLRGADRASERTPSVMAPTRILAVDDSPTFLEEIAEQLRADGYDVVKAQSGEEALQLLAIEPVDGILLDHMLPGLSGTETCKRIKNSPATRRVPLMMLTAQEDPRAVVDGMNAGADDYIAKSVDPAIIKARLRAQLRRKRLEDESRRVRERILQKDAEARAAREQASAREELLRELEEKHRALQLLNQELQMFAYSVSHDLRQPLRGLDGFSQALLEDHAEALDDRGRHYLQRIRAGAQRMGALIDGLLLLSRVTRKELRRSPLRLDDMARRVFERLREADPERDVSVSIDEPLAVEGDGQLLESVLENLIGNAWKFTGRAARPRIEVGLDEGTGAFFVRDNGAGFDMEYADKLFAVFQRLHSENDFEGTGVGLAICQRIVHRHGGSMWAESQTGQGATFFFTLGRHPGEMLEE